MGRMMVETARLVLREMEVGDLGFVAEMLTDPKVMRHYPRTYSREDAKTWVGTMMMRQERDGHALWLTSLRETGKPIGQIGLLKQCVDEIDETEVGYMVHPNYWQLGYAREAAAAVRDYAFHTLGKDRVISLIRPANIPSQRVALSIGMKPEKLTVFKETECLVFSLAREAYSNGACSPRRD
jgi:ribosomal-protein-alanine N-acetyltransferase